MRALKMLRDFRGADLVILTCGTGSDGGLMIYQSRFIKDLEHNKTLRGKGLIELVTRWLVANK